MRIDSADDLGLSLRTARRRAGLSQQQAATRAGLSRRWLSELEGGKSTAEVGLVLKLVAALDLVLELHPAPQPEVDLDDLLNELAGDDHDG